MRRRLSALPAILLIAAVLAPPAQALPAREIAGVALHPWAMTDPGEVERTFADLDGLGVRWARVDLRWNVVEPTGPVVAAGRGNWREIDQIVAAARPSRDQPAADRRVLASLGQRKRRAVGPSPDAGIRAFLRRGPAALSADSGLGAVERAELRGLRQARSGPGGLRRVPAHGPPRARRGGVAGQADLRWPRAGNGYRHHPVGRPDERLGDLGLIDGLGVHPYSSAAPDRPGSWMMRLEELHERMTFFGRPDLKLWLSEYGAPISPVTTGWGPAGVTEEEQAAWLRLAFATATQLPFVENLTWFEYRDSCADPAIAECHFGLLCRDHSPRPAHQALREVVAESTRLQPQIALSVVPPKPAGSGLRMARGGLKIRVSTRYAHLKGWLFLPGSPSSDTPMVLRVFRRGAAPRPRR